MNTLIGPPALYARVAGEHIRETGLTCLGESTPYKITKRKNLYMNRAAMQLRKRKKDLWRKYGQTQDILDHARFVRCRNQLRKLTRNLRKEYEIKLVSAIKQNPKAFWRYSSSRLKTKSRVEDLLDERGTLTSNSQAKAEILSRYFSSVFTVESNDDPPTVNCDYNGPLLPLLDDIDVAPDKVRAKLASLRPNSSSGPDNIHPRVLCESPDSLSVPLSILFRKSIDAGRLPADWKVGEVVPIYKKGDRQRPASYRPVSLTAVPSKVLESIVRDNLLNHLSESGLLNDAQHGFLPKRSRTSQLLEVMEDWSGAIEDGEPVDVAYLDFAKAFDSVPHKRLLGKLHAYGIRGRLLDWIAAFLLDRRQRVVIQGSKSEWAPVTSGIPQGSVLGPTLFTLFVNGMPQQVSSCVKLFADDTKLYRRVTNGSTELQADIDALVKWSKEWLLPFNSTKCRVMHLGRRNAEHSYLLDGASIQEVREERDLGVVCGRRTEVPPANGGGDRKSFPNVGSGAAIVRQPRRGHTPAALQDSSQAVPRVWKHHLGTFRKSRPEAPRTRATTGPLAWLRPSDTSSTPNGCVSSGCQPSTIVVAEET